jgi:signal transduction histidine kinase
MRRRDLLFFIIFGTLVFTTWIWLVLGAAPTLAALSETLHDGFHKRGESEGLIGELMRNASQAAHGADPGPQALFDYIFSLFNLALGIFLLKLRPYEITARLLAIGMVGTAVAFNLQGHDAFQVVPVDALGPVNAWHTWVHIASGLSYIFALLLFPVGHLLASRSSMQLARIPLLVLLALFFTGLSLITVDDHTLGLVVVYGLFIPAAGVSAQLRRFRRARSHEQRQQSKVLLFALLFAFLIALPLFVATQSSGRIAPEKTVDYELTVPAAGTYFFRCDPHPEDMTGTLVVEPGVTDDVVTLAAEDSRFDKEIVTLGTDGPAVIRFTNRDSDLHNVAVYASRSARDPIFIGAEFSGRETAIVAFRVFRVVFVIVPIALFAALLRFRLWEIDRVMNRTLVYGVLGAVITLTYLALVVGLGTLIGAGRRLDLFLSIAVTALLAAVFQPLRERARKLANRLVYGQRATPYEVLADLTERIGNSVATEQLIPQMARAVGEGTGAKSAEVWLRMEGGLVLSASWPGNGEPSKAMLPAEAGRLPEFAGADQAVAVTHQGELLGAITVTKSLGQTLTPVEERLLQDVAAQAGLVLRNAQLTADLQTRLQQLEESRQRIVTAQDSERRRIERDLHDGAQQNLVALSMKLGLARELSERDPAKAQALLQELQADTGEALQTLRDLARGIFPPVLADKGLLPALEAHARRCAVEVKIEAGAVNRYPSEVEAAVYFCCLEAIQNAIKHARGPVTISIEEAAERLTFEIGDGGPGFDPGTRERGTGLQNMSDRMAAVGGRLVISSSVAGGTIVHGDVPTSTAVHVQASPS